MAHFEKQLTTETKFTGRVITVSLDSVALENGATSTREVVHHNGGAAVIALHEDETITLVTQFRYAVGSELIEIPAGKLEPLENPFTAAKRELEEEAGLVADTYMDLGYIIPTCGYCTEKIYLYAAKNLHTTAQNLDEDEFVSVFRLPLAEAVEQVISGQITDSKTAVAILKLDALHRAGKF